MRSLYSLSHPATKSRSPGGVPGRASVRLSMETRVRPGYEYGRTLVAGECCVLHAPVYRAVGIACNLNSASQALLSLSNLK